MNADQHLLEILIQSASLVSSLQMQLALARAERDAAKDELEKLKEKQK